MHMTINNYNIIYVIICLHTDTYTLLETNAKKLKVMFEMKRRF